MDLDLRTALTVDDRGRICCRGQPIEHLSRGGAMWTRLIRALGHLPVDLNPDMAKVRDEFVRQMAQEEDQFTFKYLNDAPTQRTRQRERAARRQQQQQREAAV